MQHGQQNVKIIIIITITTSLEIIQLYRKFIITEINGHNMFGERTETDRQTATLHYEIPTMWEMKPRATL